MKDKNIVKWILRIAVAIEFLGHGALALGGKEQWVQWIQSMVNTEVNTSVTLLFLIGLLDVFIAVMVIVRPLRLILLWAAFWGFWTALVRPIVGESVWDFVERGANWGAPLGLLFLYGWPKNLKEWISGE